ncbi:putative ankyrin repeat protein RF_0381 isoform X2 [Saccostrea cucullata]|uniref:putative ankyrin repeat protein RF_0381 isoform X2 n=1 Tax=Saccostrea cuccullata TaxID=36930 RepID=UPI002ED059F1
MAGQIWIDKFYKCIFEKDIDTFRKTWYHTVDMKPHHIRLIVRMATRQGFVKGLRFIVQEQGAGCLDLEKSDNMFHVACKAGQVEVVKYLITLEEFDKSTTVFNSDFWYFISISSETNSIKVISVLLAIGKLDINQTSPEGVSLLFRAIENRKKRLSDYLIEQGANVTFVGTGKGTGLGNISCVCLSAMKIPSLLPALLERGGKVNDVYEKTGQSILMLAFENDADRKTVEGIVRAGANLSWKDKYGRTVFSMLKSLGQLYGVLDAGITIDDIEKQYNFSTLDFILKCRIYEKKDLLLLLEKGANPNFYGDGETSLLTNACRSPCRSEENVRILLQYGANPNHVDEKGFSVLQNILKQSSSCKAALLLLDFGAKPGDNCLWSMVQVASSDDMWLSLGKRLLEEGADPNEKSEDKQSILSVAIERKCVELAEELVRYGADINYIDHFDRSPLNYACRLGIGCRELRCLSTLLKYSVKLDIRHVFEHIGVLGKTCDKAYSSNYQHIFTFDVKGVFQLFIAGADLMNKQPGSYRYDDYYDDYDDYDDYYDNDDNYYDNDHQEMIFDTESDEWIPIWW